MTLRFLDSARQLSLSVHDLVDPEGFTGSIQRGAALSGPARMAAGRAAHLAFQQRRAGEGGFRAEVPLERAVRVGAWTVTVSGRADGWSEVGRLVVIDEVKTTQLDAAALDARDPESWGSYLRQLEVYLWMAAARPEIRATGRLVLQSLSDSSSKIIEHQPSVIEIDAWIQERLLWMVGRRERRMLWMSARQLRSVPRPFEVWREGQGYLAELARKGILEGRAVLGEAPTGLGKTAAVLYGALQSALEKNKQVFWTTSRNTQAAGVEATLMRFTERGLPLRYAVLQGRDKLCLLDEVRCHPATCAFADRYFDKLRGGALEAALHKEKLGVRALKRLGRDWEVCPYQLALDASAEVDVVVGDLNYVFSPEVMLKRHFGEDAQDWIVVADEAHQVVDRVREALSPALPEALALRALEGLRPAVLRAAASSALALLRAAERAGAARDGSAVVAVHRPSWVQLAERFDQLTVDYARQLQTPGDPWLELAWAVARWVRRLVAAGEETLTLADSTPGREGLRLLCLDPSAWLAERHRRLGGLIATSATLRPAKFYQDLLGIDPNQSHHLSLASPFPAERRPVFVVPTLSTAWRDRVAAAPATAALISALVAATPGNTAVYFSSFAMLDDIMRRVEMGGRELLVQRPSMSEDARRRALDALSQGGPKVLAAVLGGVFAEGIDTPAGALAAVLIVGPALPPVGLDRDLLRAHYQARYGAGFHYAMLIPGMTRVIQAAGRLVRRMDDRGVVVLIDERFQKNEYSAMLPESWSVQTPADPVAAVRAFWESA